MITDTKLQIKNNQAKEVTEEDLRRQRWAALAINRIALHWEREYAALTAPVIVTIERYL